MLLLINTFFPSFGLFLPYFVLHVFLLQSIPFRRNRGLITNIFQVFFNEIDVIFTAVEETAPFEFVEACEEGFAGWGVYYVFFYLEVDLFLDVVLGSESLDLTGLGVEVFPPRQLIFFRKRHFHLKPTPIR